jgi:hypothetical protein
METGELRRTEAGVWDRQFAPWLPGSKYLLP